LVARVLPAGYLKPSQIADSVGKEPFSKFYLSASVMSTPIFSKSAATSWPANTPMHIKLAVEDFFQLLDGYSAEAAVRWSQLYHTEGEFQAFGKVFKGHEGMCVGYSQSILDGGYTDLEALPGN
jgi:hypothetical protein